MRLRRRNVLVTALGAATMTALPALRAASGAPAVRAEWLSRLWSAYKRRYLQEDGRVIEHSQAARSHSEGQSYALFHSLIYDDRPAFERVLKWTIDNLCAGDCAERLPAWLWGRADGERWSVIDDNNAADSDLMMIYALREAARLWDHASYRALAEVLARRLLAECTAQVPGIGLALLPGKRGFDSADGWRLNPSYQILPALRALDAADENGAWAEVLKGATRMLKLAASADGYAPDWLRVDNDGRVDRQGMVVGGYDAIRVYFWLAVTPGTRALLNRYRGMRALARRPVLPEVVEIPSGDTRGTAPPGFSAALLPYLGALGAMRSHRRHRAVVAEALESDPELTRLRYYDANLILFGLGADLGRFGFNGDGTLRLGRHG